MKNIIVLFLLILQISIYAKEVKVVFSHTTPPYVFTNGTGITIKLVEEALKYKGHTIKNEFINIARGIEMFKNGYVDANALVQKGLNLKGYYSDFFMQYHNVAYTLKSSNIILNNLEDLQNYNFISFQKAHIYLGDRFKEVSQKAGDKYSELSDQKQQVYMFLKGRTQVVVLEKHIYQYYKNLLISENKVSKDIEENPFYFFEPTKYRVIFNDEKIRDDFNEGIKHLKQTGRYDEIFKEYSEQFFYIEP